MALCSTTPWRQIKKVMPFTSTIRPFPDLPARRGQSVERITRRSKPYMNWRVLPFRPPARIPCLPARYLTPRHLNWIAAISLQNSNDSFWLIAQPVRLPACHPVQERRVEQSLAIAPGPKIPEWRDDASGVDGKFSLLNELETTLLNNRTYLGEAVLSDLITQCQAQGTTQSTGKPATGLRGAGWLGQQNEQGRSTGAIVFREFAQQFRLLDNADKWQTAFDSANPLDTPNTFVNGRWRHS